MSHICIKIGQPPKFGLPESDFVPLGHRNNAVITHVKIESGHGSISSDKKYNNALSIIIKHEEVTYTVTDLLDCIRICISPLKDVYGLALKIKDKARLVCRTESRSLCNQVYTELAYIDNYYENDGTPENSVNIKCVSHDIYTRMSRCRIVYRILAVRDNGTSAFDLMCISPSDIYSLIPVQPIRNTDPVDTDSSPESWFATGQFIFVPTWSQPPKAIGYVFVFESIENAMVYNRELLDASSNTLIREHPLNVDMEAANKLETKNRKCINKIEHAALFKILTILRDDTVSQLLSVKITSQFAVTIPNYAMVNANVVALFAYYLQRFGLSYGFKSEYLLPFAEIIKASLARDRFLSLGPIRHKQSIVYDQTIARCENQLAELQKTMKQNVNPNNLLCTPIEL